MGDDDIEMIHSPPIVVLSVGHFVTQLTQQLHDLIRD
jgi:hypothetical protein